MIPIKIDLREKIIYIDEEEYFKHKQYYDSLQIKTTGKCSTKDIPYIELDYNYD